MFTVNEFTVPSKQKITNDEYHAHPATGSSDLKIILRSPAHYKYEKQNKSEPTPAMRFGTLAHAALLEPKIFAEAVEIPIFEGTGSRKAKEEWFRNHHGKMVLKADEMDTIRGMLVATSKNKTARALLAGGAAEEAFFDQCQETGVVRKAKPDFIRDNIIVDIKTTVDADPSEFAKQIAKLKYHLSAAYYLDVVGSVLGTKLEKFVIVAIEKEPPYGVSVHLLDEGTIDAGRHLYRKALKILKECKDKNEWPGYPDKILSTAIPHYAFPVEEAI